MAKTTRQLTVEQDRERLATEEAESTRQQLLRVMADEQAKGKRPRWRRLRSRLKELTMKNQIVARERGAG